MKRLAIMVCLSLAASVWSMADIIRVPKDQPTIQAGIDAADTGDTVFVARGTYYENIDFKGKTIVVRSADGAMDTVIDGGSAGTVVTFESGEQRNTALNGFTLTNGAEWGAGIRCRESSPTVKNNILIKNDAGESQGGAVHCTISCVTFTNNLFAWNSAGIGGAVDSCWSAPVFRDNVFAYNSAGGAGGAVSAYYSFPVFERNLFIGNAARYGGAVACSVGDSTFKRNTFIGNHAKDEGGGIRVLGPKTTSIITGNIISENYAGLEGGGILAHHVKATVANNLIFGNKAGTGGGLDGYDSSLSLMQNTVTGNTAGLSGGALHLKQCFPVKLVNSILWNNTANSHKEIHDENSNVLISFCDIDDPLWSGSPSCFQAPPLFVDAANGDYHLTYPSPCRDSGDVTAVTESIDFEGDPRIADSRVDLGADEFHPHLYFTGDAVPGGTVTGKLIGRPGTSPVGLLFGTGVSDPPMLTPYGRCFLTPPMVLLQLGSIPAEGVLAIPVTLPHAAGMFPMQGLIGLGPESLTNLCVLEIQ